MIRSYALPLVLSLIFLPNPFNLSELRADDPVIFTPDRQLFPYVSQRGDLNFCDVLTLKDGAKHIGKVMEWADKVLLFKVDGRPHAFDVSDVEQFEFRRFARQKIRPDAPDLTVAFVERLPRDPSWQGRVPTKDGLPTIDPAFAGTDGTLKEGTQATFKIHILNAGTKKSSEVACKVSIDDKVIGTVKIPPLNPGASHAFESTWAWQRGPHMLHVEIDPEKVDKNDTPRWNNSYEEPTQAVSLAIVIDNDEYARFAGGMNLVDTYSFEDWMQYQIRALNGLMSESRYPSSPEGIKERVRLDRIIITHDPMDEQVRATWSNALRQKGQAGGLPEYGALLVFEDSGTDAWSRFRPLKVDWQMLQQIARQLGLIDLNRTDTQVDQCLALNHSERYVELQHFFPQPDTMMYKAGPFKFTEPEAAFLNHIITRPRGINGDYLYQVPSKVLAEVRTCDGTLMEGVRVDAYQLKSEGELAGYISGSGPRDPLYSTATGPDGRAELINQEAPSYKTQSGYELRPNIFGKIACDGSNGLLLLHLAMGEAEEFHFVSLFDLNKAFLRGAKDQFVIELDTRFGVQKAPAPPPTTAILMDERNRALPPMQASWYMPPGQDFKRIDEFRVYQKTSLAGDDAAPYTLAATIRRINRRWVLIYEGSYFDVLARPIPSYSLDTFFSVASVDKDGLQSNLSPPGYLAYDKYALKFAIDQDAAYATLGGPGPMQMLRWDGQIGTHPFGVRSVAFPGFQAHNAGIAITSDHRIVCTDPVNHVLAFYDLRGDLEEVSPKREMWPGFASDDNGEFNDPVDVAVDDKGQLYVADRGNNRIQILDPQARFVGLLDESFHFDGPHAVAYSNGHLAVTDSKGTRCRIYDLTKEQPEMVRELNDLVDVDRAIVSPLGRVYMTGKDRYTEKEGVLIWGKDDNVKPERIVDNVDMGKVYSPRGMYLYKLSDTDQYAYFVNMFPFDVRRIKLDPDETAPKGN